MGIAIAPLLAIIAVVEPDGPGQTAVTWRVAGLLAAAWGLLALSALFGRSAAGSRMRRLRALRIPTALAAGLAAVAGTVQG
ncbi:hypothetical protein, partial [Streptomyces anulatus]|uniref:hypothetical protein n=1 Tax=Streptomyces anulatus TaxID=1892 RepID=UPI001C26F9D7